MKEKPKEKIKRTVRRKTTAKTRKIISRKKVMPKKIRATRGKFIRKKSVNPLIRNGIIKKSITKILAILLIIGLNWAGLSAVGQTVAYFNDTETSIENTFSAGTLDISADGLGDFSLNLNPNNQAVRNVMVGNDESLGVKYLVEASDIEGDLCDYLKVKAMLVGDVKYEGSLVDLLSEIIEIDSSAPNKNWNFKISFSGDEDDALNLVGGACQFNFHFKSWQTNIDEYNEGSGFTDQEKVFTKVVFTVPQSSNYDVVLNEILPNPEGDDGQGGLQGEWVELYNNGAGEVDLAGWYIKDASQSGNKQVISNSNAWNGRTLIGAVGSGLEWVVVFMSGKILNNKGDTATLYNKNDNKIDEYIFGKSKNDKDSDSNNTPAGDNENPAGNETAGNEGKSYARIPDGVGAWVDPIPTPGGPNKLEEVIQENTSQEEANVEVNTEEIPEEVGSTEEIIVEITVTETAIPPETAPETIVEQLPVEEVPAEPAEEVILEIIPEVVPEEPPVIEEQPVVAEELITEEHPVIVPDNNSSQNESAGGSDNGDGGNDGGELVINELTN